MPQKLVHKISIVNRNRAFDCDEEQALLIGMEQGSKRLIRVGCRGGGCGVCKVKIVSGNYQCKAMSKAHISTVEREEGFALACRVYPRSDISLETGHFIPPKSSQDQITAVSIAERLKK